MLPPSLYQAVTSLEMIDYNDHTIMSLTTYTCYYYYYAPDLTSLINKNLNLAYVALYYHYPSFLPYTKQLPR